MADNDEWWRLLSPALALAAAAQGGFGGMGVAGVLGGNSPLTGGGSSDSSGLTYQIPLQNAPPYTAGPTPPVAPPIVNAGLPSTPTMPGVNPNAQVYIPPQGPMSLGPSMTPQPPGAVSIPSPIGAQAGTEQFGPRQPDWLERNLTNPLSEMWNGKQKLDASGNPMFDAKGQPIMDRAQLTERQKALVGAAGSIGSTIGKAAAPAAAPVAGGGAGGAQAFRSTPLDAARISQARLQQLQLLRQQATLNAPWLKRYQQPGLMG